jgi:hypothetical protein
MSSHASAFYPVLFLTLIHIPIGLLIMLRHPAIRIDGESVSGNRLGITLVRMRWDSIMSINEIEYRPDPLLDFFDRKNSAKRGNRPTRMRFEISAARSTIFKLRFSSTIDDVGDLFEALDDRIGLSRPDLHTSIHRFTEALRKGQQRATDGSEAPKS